MATSTPEAIRDRAITVIQALTPASDSGVTFREYRNEGGADFKSWAESNPTACRRRFQVRTTGMTDPPPVSDTLVEEHTVTLRLLVAYPQTGRDGPAQALDRDDTLDVDSFQIDKAIGLLGRPNFIAPYADATWRSGAPSQRAEGDGVDFIEIDYVYTYQRAR